MPRGRTQRRTRKRHLIVPIVTGPIAGGNRISPMPVGSSTGTTEKHFTSDAWTAGAPPLGPRVGAANYHDPRTAKGATGGRRRKSRRGRRSRRRHTRR